MVILKLILPTLRLNRNAKNRQKILNVPQLRVYFENNFQHRKELNSVCNGVNKTYAPPLTYALLLSSVPLSGEVNYLNEMATEFMKYSGCMYLCMYVCMMCMYNVCVRAQVRAYMYVCMYVCMERFTFFTHFYIGGR